MAKNQKSVANKTRTAKAKGTSNSVQVVIIDENPAHVPYPNPPGFQFVQVEVTDANGKTEEQTICIGLDQLNRIKKSK